MLEPVLLNGAYYHFQIKKLWHHWLSRDSNGSLYISFDVLHQESWLWGLCIWIFVMFLCFLLCSVLLLNNIRFRLTIPSCLQLVNYLQFIKVSGFQFFFVRSSAFWPFCLVSFFTRPVPDSSCTSISICYWRFILVLLFFR